MAIIEVSELTKYYGKYMSIEAVSFAVEKGEIFGIAGEADAGKTTVLDILAGVVKPTSGSATVCGLDVQKDASQVSRIVRVVSQTGQSYAKIRAKTVGKYLQGILQEAARQRAQRWCEQLGLKADDTLRKMSKQQRIALYLVHALIAMPRVLFLDDPFTDVQEDFIVRLKQFLVRENQRGLTIVVTARQMQPLQGLCTAVVQMHEGRMGQVQRIMQPRQMRDANAEVLRSEGPAASVRTDAFAQEMDERVMRPAQVQQPDMPPYRQRNEMDAWDDEADRNMPRQQSRSRLSAQGDHRDDMLARLERDFFDLPQEEAQQMPSVPMAYSTDSTQPLPARNDYVQFDASRSAERQQVPVRHEDMSQTRKWEGALGTSQEPQQSMRPMKRESLSQAYRMQPQNIAYQQWQESADLQWDERSEQEAAYSRWDEHSQQKADDLPREERLWREAVDLQRGQRPRREAVDLQRGQRPRQEAVDLRWDERPRQEATDLRWDERQRQEAADLRWDEHEHPRQAADLHWDERPRREAVDLQWGEALRQDAEDLQWKKRPRTMMQRDAYGDVHDSMQSDSRSERQQQTQYVTSPDVRRGQDVYAPYSTAYEDYGMRESFQRDARYVPRAASYTLREQEKPFISEQAEVRDEQRTAAQEPGADAQQSSARPRHARRQDYPLYAREKADVNGSAYLQVPAQAKRRITLVADDLPTSFLRGLGATGLYREGDRVEFFFNGPLDTLIIALSQVHVRDLRVSMDIPVHEETYR